MITLPGFVQFFFCFLPRNAQPDQFFEHVEPEGRALHGRRAADEQAEDFCHPAPDIIHFRNVDQQAAVVPGTDGEALIGGDEGSADSRIFRRDGCPADR